MHWKDFFYFTRKERLGILTLLLLILILTILLLVIPLLWRKSPSEKTILFQQRYKSFIEQRAQLKDSLRQHNLQLGKLALFNPNTASEPELISAGLTPHIARNIINYRKKGGVFKNKAHLKKLYTISDSIYMRIEPYIALPTSASKQHQQEVPNLLKSAPDNQKHKMVKYKEARLLALNRVDTIELKKIPGIGSYIAQKIVKYRNQLGGYYSIQQLEEINIKSDLLKDWFIVDPTQIAPININTSDFKTLLKHPYLSYEQVKAIFNYKDKHGQIKSIKQLQFLDEFDAKDMERLTYYLSFN